MRSDANPSSDVHPSTCGNWDADEDGLEPDVERDAGLNPCKADTDEDGCSDAAELLLGGCDDPRNAIAFNPCFQNDLASGRVQFRAPPRDAGAWPELTVCGAGIAKLRPSWLSGAVLAQVARAGVVGGPLWSQATKLIGIRGVATTVAGAEQARHCGWKRV